MSDTHFLLLLRRFWKQISHRRRIQLGALTGLMLVGTVAELLSLGMVLPFLGALTAPARVFANPWASPLVRGLGLTTPQQLLLPLTLLFGVAAALSGVLRLALVWCQTYLANAIGVDLGTQAYRRTLYQPYSVHTSRNTSELISALMTKINTIVYFIIIPVLTMVTSALVVLTVLAFMMYVDARLTGEISVAFGGLYLLVAYLTKRQLAVDGRRVTQGQNHVAQVVQEGLGGIREVLLDSLQEVYYRILERADRQMRRALSYITFMQTAPRPVIESFGLILIGMLAYSMSTRRGGMTEALPVLGALALAAQRLLPLIQQGYAGWTAVLGGQASLGDVLDLLEQPLPAHSGLPPPQPLPFRQQISVHGLHFRYQSDGPWVLRGVDLHIPRGTCIGFIGATGSGKSTLLDLVMGLLNPTTGTLRIDGIALNESNQRAWQVHIAHVPQVIYLADTTIAENIAFGARVEDIDRVRVRQAAERAQIADTIEAWAHGYDTVVGERGIRLSGGQRQRIGIARALYKQTDVIVFDEATSALDDVTERAVIDAVDSLGTDLTILMVAHRLSTLKNCDQLVELREGIIQRIGTYRDLIEPSLQVRT